jgi:hypothetical protein
MTLGDAKGATMLSKGPWVLDTLVGSTINSGKGEKIIDGMTLGGGKKSPNAKERTFGCWVYYKKCD